MLLLAWLAGCESGLHTYEVAPREGEWALRVAVDVDECGLDTIAADAPLLPGAGSVWVAPSEAGFTVALGGGDPAACELSGESFTCLPALERTRLDDELLVSNAVLLSGWVTEGVFMQGDVAFDWKCVGAECMEFEAAYGTPAPCRVDGIFEAEPG